MANFTCRLSDSVFSKSTLVMLEKDLRLLTLEGGGVRDLSALIIFE